MKKTIKEVNNFAAAAQIYLAKNPNETKFSYALKKVTKKIDAVITPIQEDIKEKVNDNYALFAITDEKTKQILYEKEVTIEPNGNKVERNTTTPLRTAQMAIDLNKATSEINKKFLATEIEFEPYPATEIPELTEDEKEAFAGYVIPE